jgi:hypothetical protein
LFDNPLFIKSTAVKKRRWLLTFFSSESRVGRLTNKPKGLVKLDFIKARNEGYLERG